MALGDKTYSRLIAWLKILLPLIALGLLSTLFLISRPVDPTATLPFTDRDLAERTGSQQITRPIFSGRTSGGALLTVTADTARPDDGVGATAQSFQGEILLDTGRRIRFSSDSAVLDQSGDQADLLGDVRFETSDGYALTSDKLVTAITRVEAESPGPVRGTAPAGSITAGGMTLRGTDDTDDLQLVFTDGVRLLYDPKDRE